MIAYDYHMITIFISLCRHYHYTLKMLCLYILGQNCLHLTFKPYLSSETYSRQYEKLPSIVVHACKKYYRKMYLLKMSAAVVTHPLWVQDVPGSIPGSGKGFYVWIFVLLLLCFYTLFIRKVCNSFYNINLFSILNILQYLWPIIRV